MSTDQVAEQVSLRELVRDAAAKERKVLSLSIILMIVLLAGGFSWIAYSANKVISLKAEQALVVKDIEEKEIELKKVTDALDEKRKALDTTTATLNNVANGIGDAKQQAKTALVAVSKTQESPRTGANPKTPIPTPSPSPTTSPGPCILIPKVTGLSFTEAQQAIRQLGFVPIRKDPGGPRAPDRVLYQDPVVGVCRFAGSEVFLYVPSGGK
jgi:anti-sigma-K factor RskA